MTRYLVLDVGCAECLGEYGGSLVEVLGRVDTLQEAYALCDTTHMAKCDDGWYDFRGNGERRIIELPP